MARKASPESERKGTIIGTVVILGVIAISFGIALGPGLFKDHQQQKVLESGVEAPATIIGIVDTGNRYNDNPEVLIQLNVNPEGVDSFDAEQNTVMSPVDLVKYKPGQAVRVKYDPEDPSIVAVIGL